MPDDQALLDLIASESQGILAVVKKDGHPQMSNVLYAWDTETRTARITTQADRVKGRVLKRDPKCALHVPGDHFWRFAVIEADAQLSPVAKEPGDEGCRALLDLYTALMGDQGDEDAFFARMIEQQRLVASLTAGRVYGLALDSPPGG